MGSASAGRLHLHGGALRGRATAGVQIHVGSLATGVDGVRRLARALWAFATSEGSTSAFPHRH